jgi:hypothetical protein
MSNETEIVAVADNSLALLAKAEIDIQISTAHAFPRQIKKFQSEAKTLATLDEDTAASCVYALPRGKTPIKGPSIRFAEIIASCWGNVRCGSRIVAITEKFVTAQGVCHDLERNQAHTADVNRRITYSDGGRFNDDMIGVTCNAACSIAKRNAILATIPKSFWKPIYDASLKVTIGDITTVVERREKAVQHWAKLGVSAQRICWALGKASAEEIGLDELETLVGWWTAIRENEADIERIFPASDPNAKPVEDKSPKGKAEAEARAAKAAKAATKHEAPVVTTSSGASSSPANGEGGNGASVASKPETGAESEPESAPPESEAPVSGEVMADDLPPGKTKVFIRMDGKIKKQALVKDMTPEDLADANDANEAALADPEVSTKEKGHYLGVQKLLEAEMAKRAAK